MRFVLPLMAISLVGCIVYDEQLFDEDGNPIENPDDIRDDRDDRDPPTDPSPDPDPPTDSGASLEPDRAEAGEVVIVSVLAEGGLDRVEQIQFFGPGDLSIVATSERSAEELLLTLEIGVNSPSGPNDLLLELEDGTALFLDDAFLVL